VRKLLGDVVKELKGGLKSRKATNRVRKAKPAAQARPQGGMVKVGSTMKKSRSAGFLVGNLSSPDLAGEAAAHGAWFWVLGLIVLVDASIGACASVCG
jgi:hypothetical protein